MAIPLRKFEFTRTHLFNIGGFGVIALGIIMMIKSSFSPAPDTPLCEARYQSGVLFSLSRPNGTQLVPEDLQARLGGMDRGLLTNSKIVNDPGVPFGYALEINLKRAAPDEDDQSRSGIGFTWVPRQLALANSACLSYSVWLPEGFKFGEGGVLPGLLSDILSPEELAATPEPEQGGDSQSASDGQPANNNGDTTSQRSAKLAVFSVRPQWMQNGGLAIWRAPNMGPAGAMVLDASKASLKPGRWTRIEEEVVLNDPGLPNGILRLWVDGRLVHERYDLGFRMDEVQTFHAVVGNVHNMRGGVWSAAPADSTMRLSPLELRMK